MASKKYLIILASIFTLFSFTQVNAQSSGVYNLTSYDYTDSSLIPEKRMDQQNDFMNNRYLYPAKPRNQWEVGLSIGGVNVSGDVTSRSLFNKAVDPMKTLGFAINVRKAWGYVFSTRLQYLHGSASGYNYQAGSGYQFGAGDNPWLQNGYTGNVFYNYHTKVRQVSMDVIGALNNIRYHKGANKVSYYALAGVGALLYEANVDALNNGASYQAEFDKIKGSYPTAGNTLYQDRLAIASDLKNLFDGDYETTAERHNQNRGFLNEFTFRPSVNAGFGAQFRLGKKVSLSIEDKVIFTMDDLVDGQRWQERDAMTRDMDNINYLSIGINVNLGANAVAPLWWINPNDFMYNGLASKTKSTTSKCDNDADGDGVSDCYDRCGDTPGGVAVDTHGCPLDTDGDGVADYKDKQLITPTECQPSDADGIGKCPDPECCKDGPARSGCGSIGNGSVMFSGGSRTLSSSAQNDLNTLANSMRSNPNCNVVVMGNGSSSKVAQQRSWDRVNAVINYMVDRNGVDRGRFIFQYGLGGNENAVNYRAAGNGETGPSNTPPPFPNLKRN